LAGPVGKRRRALSQNRHRAGERAIRFCDKIMLVGACVAALPMIAIFLLLQRHFLQGLTLGAVKG
jgi:ABC-type glycerol-3-phosphate transport system permease component